MELRHLRKVFRSGRRRVVAVADVTLDIPRGTIFGLLGPNGAGKTTIIKCSLGLIRPTAGSVRIAGHDINHDPVKALLQVAAVLEGSRNVYWRLSVLENLRFFANLHGYHWGDVRDRAEHLLERLGLAPHRSTLVNELSRGMQQKVAVACALVRQTPLVLLDEPTLGLDLETARQLEQELLTLVREEGKTIVISSHQMDLVERLCDRVAILRQGQLVVTDTVQNLLRLFEVRAYGLTLETPLPAAQQESLSRTFPLLRFNGKGDQFTLELRQTEDFYRLIDLLRQMEVRIARIDRMDPDLGEVFLRLVGPEREGQVS